MKKFSALMLSAILLFSLCACGSTKSTPTSQQDASTVSEPTTSTEGQTTSSEESADVSAETPDPVADTAQGFEGVLNTYTQALNEHWDGEKLSGADLSLLSLYETDAKSTIGYAYHDFNSDDTDELVIGFIPKDENHDGIILELYSLVNGKAVHLFSSQERDRYYITDLTGDGDYAFYDIGSSGASNTEFRLWLIEPQKLSCTQAIRYDSNAENQWMMGYEENGEIVYSTVADETTGQGVIDSAVNNQVHLGFLPFN